MKAQIRVLSGTMAGHTQVFSQGTIGLGRATGSDLRFDPQRDLAVSARHALIVHEGGAWIVRDLGSRNGVFVNGHRVAGGTRLADTDQIRFGVDGPALEFRLVPDGTPDGILAAARTERMPSAGVRRSSTEERVRVEVGRRTKRVRTASVLVVAAVLAAATGFIIWNSRSARARQQQVAGALQARAESVRLAADTTIRALRGRVNDLEQALRTSQARLTDVSAALEVARRAGDGERVRELQGQLAQLAESVHYQQVAAQVDYDAIGDANQRAVAMLYVEYGPGDVVTGTAFAVRRDGTLLTNRHIVAGETGQDTPTRLGARFADSDQFFPARVLAIAEDADLAVLKVDVRGGTPAVKGLNARPDTVRQGDPVALIGFPLGTDLRMSQRDDRTVARTTLTPGSVSKVIEHEIQVFGYGAPGASGSPIFDRAGEVIGVLYGGQPGSDGRVLFGVRSDLAARLLDGVR